MRVSIRVAVLALAQIALSGTAEAQSLARRPRAKTDGVLLPPTGVALADEATSPQVNPAGLSSLGGFQMLYLHERDLRTDVLGDGLAFGLALGPAKLGLSLEWMRFAHAPDFRRTGWTLAFGGDAFGLGITHNRFGSADQAYEDLSSWDLGLLVRPLEWVSIGAAIRDLDTPRFGNDELPRRYSVGLGLRPLTDRITLGVDFEADERRGLRNGVLAFTGAVEAVSGLLLHAGLGRGLNGGETRAMLGLTLNGSHAGVTYAAARGSELTGFDHVLQVRISSERYRSLPAIGERFASIDLTERLSGPGPGIQALLAGMGRDPYLELMGELARIRKDRDLSGVVLKLNGLPLGVGRAEELRQAITQVRAAGKKVVVLFQNGGDTEYLVASAADRILALPQASFVINGFSVSEVFFAEALGKIGVGMDVARVGAYKTAPDAFTRSTMSAEERQMLDSYLDVVFGRFLEVTALARGMPVEKMRAIVGRGILTARAAQEAGLVDGLAYEDELEDALQALQGRRVQLLEGVPDEVAVPRRWGGRKTVALVKIEGLIAEGESRPAGFGAPVAGADTVVKTLERLREDGGVAAVVVRVDSGGGSGSASDRIWRAMMRLRERKPVVVSMGDVAASGGYYVAAGANEILAEPGTVTGSIGVFALKPSFGGLLSKLGIGVETVRRGERADLFSVARTWTPEEQAQVQQYVESFYRDFVAKVAEGRKMTPERVDALGQGRIFSGVAAKEAGLVDRIGGLPDAVTRAAELAGLTERDYELQVVRGRLGSLPISSLASAPSAFDRAVRAALGPWGLAVLELGDEPLALMPYRIEAR